MSMSVAELYMLAFRKSMIPIIGEAVPHPFDLQIELDSWSWTLTPPEADDAEEAPKPEPADKSKDGGAKPGPSFDAAKAKKEDDDILKVIANLQRDSRRTQAQRDKAVLDKLRETQKGRRADAESAANDAQGDGTEKKKADRFTFKFTKGVDLASTQLLNSMKIGEVLPRIVLTVIHRASHAPLTLILTFKNVTLMSYDLSVDATETMSDMREEWEARFEQVDYVYQNRPGTGGIPGVTQGTARVFKMNLKKLL